MQEFIVEQRYSGTGIIKLVRIKFPQVNNNALHRAIRQKDIKVNGKRVREDYIVYEGDKVQVYISDEYLFDKAATKQQTSDECAINAGFDVIYEDDNILIVSKHQGIAVHPDRGQKENTLIDLAARYLTIKGVENPRPFLCHRLDRNTGGLIIIALNEQARDYFAKAISHGQIKKYYRCLVYGKMPEDEDILHAYLLKKEHESRVLISEAKQKGWLGISTRYKVLAYYEHMNISELEIELLTGRTHQIRAHLAYVGHPVLGDGKYGKNSINKPLGLKRQQLWACKLIFNLEHGSSKFSYLNGKIFEIVPRYEMDKQMFISCGKK